MLHKEQGTGIMSGSLYRGVNSSICRHALKLVEDQKAYLEKHQLKLRKFGIPIPECTCNFTVSMGLPCYHIIEQKLLSYQQLITTDFHRHWHLIPPSSSKNQQENIVNFGDNEIDPDSMSWSRDGTVQTFGGSHPMNPGVNEIRDPVIRRSKRMRLAANLTPTNSVVNGLINSTQRQPSRHEQAASIIIEDVDLAPAALSVSSSNLSSSGTGARRLCSGRCQPGHTYRTCDRRRVTVIED
ncbi:hypothetical protein K3495_g12817 [Podosphaera aphanis]|nr:hypothetical protein K3495_g12817 [Podosphaera aphanis]